ncbi:hypothetical protein SAMN04489834_0899 [Microterricola viridarii]|uniref:Uncharacterized protein n=2 Tax=Microterricola TaxID=518733 RepID=A0A1H1PL62_9MICO|nr:hypothetical protein SAMN04489834_0899 [Microterricola viridarii]
MFFLPVGHGCRALRFRLYAESVSTVESNPVDPVADNAEAPVYREDKRQQPKPKTKKPQIMKAETAAKKLGILLSAAPESFTAEPISREQLDAILADPPAWLVELRANGPHPRPVVAARLGVSISGLIRAEVTEPLTTAEIKHLLETKPQWLVVERATQHEVREEQIRVKNAQAGKEALAKEAQKSAKK